jgi:hypothetical protein
MKLKEKTSIIISIIALVLSSVAIYDDYKPANIDVEFQEAIGYLNSPNDTNLFNEQITLPLLFINDSKNMGVVRSVSLKNSNQEIVNWNKFSEQAMNNYGRTMDYAHPFSISGQGEKYYSVQFTYSKRNGFFGIDSLYQIIIKTNNKTFTHEVTLTPENKNWVGNGSNLIIH